jgi:nucleotide-binding universal stress UspA family protein
MKRILVPFDGTTAAKDSLPLIAEFCKPGDRVTLVSAQEPQTPQAVGTMPGERIQAPIVGSAGGVADLTVPDVPVYLETDDQTRERQRDETLEYLESVAAPLRDAGLGVDFEVILDPHTDSGLVRYAREHKPDLIVMLRWSHFALLELQPSRVVDAMLEAAIAPVLVLPVR